METVAPSHVVTPRFLVVVGATLAVFVSFGVVILALPLYVRDALAASDAGVGVAMGAGSLGAILAGPAAGRVADRRGRRVVLLVATALMLVGYLALALEPPLPVVAAVRVIAGAGEAGFVVAAFTMATDLAPADRRGEAMSLVTVGSYTGLAGGPVLADVVGSDRFAVVCLLAGACVALAAVAAVVLPETRPDTGGAPRGWLPPRPTLLPGLLILLALLGFGGFNAFAALHARDVGIEHPGLVFALFGAVVVAVRIVGRKLPDRLGARLSASIACAAIACGLVTAAVWQTEPGLFVATAVFAGGQALAYPAIVLLAMARSAPAERSAVVGTVAAFVDVALASGAFLLGLAANAAGYGAVCLAGAVSAAAGLALLATVRMRSERVADAV